MGNGTANSKRVVTDEQTGNDFVVKEEDGWDTAAAILTLTYLLVVMFFFTSQLIQVMMGDPMWILSRVGYKTPDDADQWSVVVALGQYAFVGGALGGAAKGVRSFIIWHCDLAAFGKRFFWKHLSDPWLGGLLALFAFALIHGGIAAFGGDLSTASGDSKARLSNFGLGVLAGYGSHTVLVWLNATVKRVFRTTRGKDQ